jgi:G3E family GTPase
VDLVHSKRGDVLAQAVSTATAHLLGSVREELAAVKTQQLAQEVTLNHTVTMVQDLCTALQSTVKQTVARQVEAGNRTVLAQLEQISSQQKKLQELFEQQQQQQQRVEQIRRHQQSIVDTGGVDDFGGAGAGAGVNYTADPLQQDQSSPARREFSACSYATQHTRIAADMNMNAFDVMRTTPPRPICSTIFPESWKKLYDEWNRNDLQSFLKSRQQHWDDAKLVNRYVKRHRAMRIIAKYKLGLGDNNLDDLEVLRRMDSEREDRNLSLSKHLLLLFYNDPTRTRRNRATRNNNNNNNN